MMHPHAERTHDSGAPLLRDEVNWRAAMPQASTLHWGQLVRPSGDEQTGSQEWAGANHHGRQQCSTFQSPLGQRGADTEETPHHEIACDECTGSSNGCALALCLPGHGSIDQCSGSGGRHHHPHHHDGPHEKHEHEVRDGPRLEPHHLGGSHLAHPIRESEQVDPCKQRHTHERRNDRELVAGYQ